MKLCRFELLTEPGTIRSGMVYGGKVYETDGAEAIGVHEAADVRPLCPIPIPPSIRVFRSDSDVTSFYYVNPGAVIGPSQIVELPDVGSRYAVRTYLAATVAGTGYQISLEEAESIVLGLTLVNVITAIDLESKEAHVGRSHDFGIAMGPVITTPDDLDDVMVMTKNGILYKLECSVKVNQIETSKANFEEFPISIVEAVRLASETCTLRPGDVFCVGPIFDDAACIVSPGDEFQFNMERLGALSTKFQ
ncbi:MAG TPA: fumarylacetoacetate hydrolase family protein [Fimbriimonas sp.]|nr:fumarylacetoacetate hydrolase family protein [Fimbriimonas sp.]